MYLAKLTFHPVIGDDLNQALIMANAPNVAANAIEY